jgi:hypothetical protein
MNSFHSCLFPPGLPPICWEDYCTCGSNRVEINYAERTIENVSQLHVASIPNLVVVILYRITTEDLHLVAIGEVTIGQVETSSCVGPCQTKNRISSSH